MIGPVMWMPNGQAKYGYVRPYCPRDEFHRSDDGTEWWYHRKWIGRWQECDKGCYRRGPFYIEWEGRVGDLTPLQVTRVCATCGYAWPADDEMDVPR